jgi:hypothetical protein
VFAPGPTTSSRLGAGAATTFATVGAPGALAGVLGVASVIPTGVAVSAPAALALASLGTATILLGVSPGQTVYAPPALALASLGAGSIIPGAIVVQLHGARSSAVVPPAGVLALATVGGVGATVRGAAGSSASITSSATVAGVGATVGGPGVPSASSFSTIAGSPGARAGRVGAPAVAALTTVTAPGAAAGALGGGGSVVPGPIVVQLHGARSSAVVPPSAVLSTWLVGAPGAVAFLGAGVPSFVVVAPTAIRAARVWLRRVEPLTRITATVEPLTRITATAPATPATRIQTTTEAIVLNIGDTATFDASLDIDDALTDPTTLELVVSSPSGIVTSYSYPSVQIVRLSRGVYRVFIDCTEAGVWRYRLVSTGAAKGAEPGSFRVQPNEF